MRKIALLMLTIAIGVSLVRAAAPAGAVAIPAGRPGLQLPFAKGLTWTMTCGYGCHPQDNWNRYAVDFAPRPSTDRTIYAPIGGRVTVESTRQCWIRIEGPNGWFINMMHTDRALVPNGSTVSAGQPVGVVGAKFGGPCGVGSGTHLHVSLMHRDADRVSRSYPFGSMSCNSDAVFGPGQRAVSWACAPAPPGTPPSPASGDRMLSGQQLTPGQSITSANGCFRLIYQGDGNLVLYRVNGWQPLWASNTVGSARNAIMQTDGNFVVYNASGAPRWHSNTYGNAGAWLVMQDDGNAVIYRAGGGAIWATNTVRACSPSSDRLQSGQQLTPGQSITSTNGCFRLVYQGDGNLVVYRVNGWQPIWASSTVGSARNAIMQSDGNFVVYNASGSPRWASNTHGNPGAWVVMQSDGNLVVYRSGGGAIWASNTVRAC